MVHEVGDMSTLAMLLQRIGSWSKSKRTSALLLRSLVWENLEDVRELGVLKRSVKLASPGFYDNV